MRRFIYMLPIVALLGACATVPVPLKGEFAISVPARRLAVVRLAKKFAGVARSSRSEPGRIHNLLRILSRELDKCTAASNATPVRGASWPAGQDSMIRRSSQGARTDCHRRVDGTEKGKVGKYDYTYPQLAADTIYLWPKRPLIIQTAIPGRMRLIGAPMVPGGGRFLGAPPVLIIKPNSPPSSGGGKR